MFSRSLLFIVIIAFWRPVLAQSPRESLQSGSSAASLAYPQEAYQRVITYINPILPGDHPDPTVLKVGRDFYMCGSSFHFAPNLAVLHSTDLVHWETISRVVPADWTQMKNDAPGGGIWQGAITYFYGTYRIYFSNNSSGGQYFSQAATPAGPWSEPIKVKGTAETGFTGYDNSVFVDDDGTPYLIIKSGRNGNRIQQINHYGHLTGSLIDMDWINANNRYSWGEGPVMSKRNGWYYYFVAGDVNGGQYALRSKILSGDSTKWEKLGEVFKYKGNRPNPFPGPNHMSAPFQLADGTWWCLAQSYEKVTGNDWSGQGRQELLCRLEWDKNGKPSIQLNDNHPYLQPDLRNEGLSWKLPRSDEFSISALNLQWHFLNRQCARHYSFNMRPGWLTINPENDKSHVLQKEAGHYYTLVTKVDNDPVSDNQQGGIYLSNGNESVNVKLYSGFAQGKRKIIFALDKQKAEADFLISGPVWLKFDRQEHQLSAYYSQDGINWHQVGQKFDATALDGAQPNFNSWVGNSIGLYAQGKTAQFDFFIYKDAYSVLPIAGYNNYFGVETTDVSGAKVVSVSSGVGAWLMLGGVDFGNGRIIPGTVELTASLPANGKLEVWIDDIGGKGRKIADISIKPKSTGNLWQTATANVFSGITGQHDLFLKVNTASSSFFIKSVRFLPKPIL